MQLRMRVAQTAFNRMRNVGSPGNMVYGSQNVLVLLKTFI